MPFAIILSQASESSDEAICKTCGRIIQESQGFNVKRILGKGDLWITEYTITYRGRPAYTLHNGIPQRKVVHETQYFAAPIEAPAWRSQWVQRIA